MASSFSFQKTVKLVKKMSEDVVWQTADEILGLLQSQGSFTGKYAEGQGISPYDKFRRKSGRHVMYQWQKQKRKASDGSTTVQFVNRSNYAQYLYGREESSRPEWRGVNKNFRSSQKHAWQMYDKAKADAAKEAGDKKEYNKLKSYKYAPKRPNQLTKQKWESFLKYVKKELKSNTLGYIAKAHL